MVIVAKVTPTGRCFVDVRTPNKSKAVNSVAQDMIVSLDTILGQKADFQPTTSNSTQVVDLESGITLYNVRTIERSGGHFQVGVYPQTNDAREYLRKVVIDHLPQ